jgi:hypothetical protein
MRASATLAFFCGIVSLQASSQPSTLGEAGALAPGEAAAASSTDLPLTYGARLALVIGSGAYAPNGLPRLRNAVNDADLMATALEEVGFKVTKITDAGEDQMESAITEFGKTLREAGPEAVGLYYFSGHGVQSDGINYMMPVDANVESVEDVQAEAPRMGLVERVMQRAGNATNFIILDACRDNNLPAQFRSVERGLIVETARSGGNMLIAYSTRPGWTADDGAGANSPYTTVLARLMRSEPVPAINLFTRVADAVRTDTMDRQQPWYESGLRDDTFCFRYCATSAPPPPVRRSGMLVERGEDLRIDPTTPAPPGVVLADEITISGTVPFPRDTFWVANSIVFDEGARVVAEPLADVRMAAARFANLNVTANGANGTAYGAAGASATNAFLLGVDFNGGTVAATGGNGSDGASGRPGANGRAGNCDGFGKYRGAARGDDGLDGGPGGSGGNGGIITFYSAIETPDITFNAAAGLGADGGVGGRGGRGGAGCVGLGGAQSAAGNGIPGRNGSSGSPGGMGEVRLRYVDANAIRGAVREALALRPVGAAQLEAALTSRLPPAR